MKNAHFLVWFGLGGVLSNALAQFLPTEQWRIGFFTWFALLLAGLVISTRKKKSEN